MSEAELNEAFQWIAIGLVFFLNVALYRQFGLMMIDSRTLQTETFGPSVGSRVNRRVAAGFPEPLRSWNLMVFVLESCKTCEQFLEGLRQAGALDRRDLQVVLAYKGDDSLADELTKQYPSCFIRPVAAILGPRETLGGREVTGYPFSLLLDSERILVAKNLGNDAQPVLDLMDGDARPEAEGRAEAKRPVGAAS